MKGSDIVYYERSSNRLVDAFATENAKPETDCGSQDWTLVASSFTEGVMKVRISDMHLSNGSMDCLVPWILGLGFWVLLFSSALPPLDPFHPSSLKNTLYLRMHACITWTLTSL